MSAISNAHRGAELYSEVLHELDSLKETFGGAPNYDNSRPPAIDKELVNETLFGQPKAAVNDWFIKKGKKSKAWKFLGKLAGVSSSHHKETRYEYIAKAVQRFGLLIQNQEEIIDTEKNGKDSKHLFNRITGLAWHPDTNGIGTEKIYFEMLNKFLTEEFQQAKASGNEELIKYFDSFDGVCFEDRMRHIENYLTSKLHSSESIESTDYAEILECADYDSSNTAAEVFEKESIKLFEKLGKAPSPIELKTHLEKKGIFEREFSIGNGLKEVPSLKDFQSWVIFQQQMYVLDPYASLDEFLDMEREVCQSSGGKILEHVTELFKEVPEDEVGSIISDADSLSDVQSEIIDRLSLDSYSSVSEKSDQ